MKLEKILPKLALDTGIDADELIAYAKEDKEGGWEEKLAHDSSWPIGSIHPDEGKILYALIRAMRPSVVVEFGVASGCSSKHILKALVKNKKGKLYSYDPVAAPLVKRFTAAENKRWVVTREKGQMTKLPSYAEIVVEDTYHTVNSTFELCELGLLPIKTVRPEESACGYGYWVNK
jgi:hypothetical protein